MTYQRPFPGVATEGSRECFWELVADIKNGYGLGGKAERVYIKVWPSSQGMRVGCCNKVWEHK